MRRIALLPSLLLLLAVGVAAVAPGAQAKASVCRMPDVGGLSAQAARTRIKAAGCTGTIFRTTICLPTGASFVPLIGKVQEQTPLAGIAIPSTKAVEILVGINGEGSVCTKLNPPKPPVTGFAALDGDWTATFTVQQSPGPPPGIPPIGQKLTGVTFTVTNGQLGGMLNGTISSAGYADPNVAGITDYDANVSATMLGFSCQGKVTFWIYHDNGEAASNAGITCGSSPNQIVGLLLAGQNQ